MIGAACQNVSAPSILHIRNQEYQADTSFLVFKYPPDLDEFVTLLAQGFYDNRVELNLDEANVPTHAVCLSVDKK